MTSTNKTVCNAMWAGQQGSKTNICLIQINDDDMAYSMSQKKTCHFTLVLGITVKKCWPIFEVLSLLDSAVNFLLDHFPSSPVTDSWLSPELGAALVSGFVRDRQQLLSQKHVTVADTIDRHRRYRARSFQHGHDDGHRLWLGTKRHW